MSQKTNQAETVGSQKGWETPGIILRRMRRERGLAADQVCSQLGLTQRALKALESDDYDKLPAAVYVRGYIRRYCELLDIRVEPVLSSFESYALEISGEASPTREVGVLRAFSGSRLAVLAGLTLLVFAMMFWAAGGWSKESDGDYGVASVEAAVPSPAVAAGAEVQTNVPDQKTDGGVAPANQVAGQLSSPDELRFAFDHDSWIEVIDGQGKLLVIELQKAGSELLLKGKPPFDVRLGYGPGVTIFYIGQRVPVNADAKTYAARLLVGE